LVRRAYRSVAIPAGFSDVRQPVERPPAAIATAFLRANPRSTPDSIVVTCSGQGSPRLREVHICFDRTLNPRACSADVLRSACRVPTLIVPPVR
jgi:ribonuclease T2